MVSICRLCASLKKTENLTFIRDSNHDLCQKLSKCFQLCIDVKDSLPKGVCPECIRSLNLSFEFFERVHESQQSLRKLLNVESSEADTNSNDDAEQKSVALIAAAATAEKEELINDSNDSTDSRDAVVTVNENDTDEVAQVIKEILGVKGDQTASYLILESDVEDDPPKTEFIEEKDQDDVNPDEMLSTDTYPVIEFIDGDEEEIDFEGEQFEIIEGTHFEDETHLDQEWKYEIQDVEQLIEEAAKPANCPPPVIDAVQKTWAEYPWKCVRCLYVCCTANELIEHNEKVHFVRAPDMEWLCADCQKTFPRYYSLINHIRSRHHSQLNLLCDICNENSNSFKDMEKHRQEMHQDEQNLIMLLCVICGKGFHTPNSLQIHSKCHLPDDERLRYPCNMCDKKFRTSSNLKFHIKMHTGTRDYVCDQCGKNFVQRANLEEHLVSHINFTPYECSICSKLFKTPERLTRHKLRHTDEKPFSCTVCDRTFRTKDAMLTHTRIHTGEMPFSCEFCEKPFRFRSTLMTHHNVHTGTRPYSCLDCNHHFTNWPNYNKHMKRRHGIDVSSKNPRGTKPSNAPKPLKQPRNPKTATTKSHSMVKRARNQDIRVEDVEEDDANVVNVAVEYEPDGDINITVPKQEEEKPDDNYEDAI